MLHWSQVLTFLAARPGLQRLQRRVTGSVLVLLGLRFAAQER